MSVSALSPGHLVCPGVISNQRCRNPPPEEGLEELTPGEASPPAGSSRSRSKRGDDSNPGAIFGYAADELAKREIAFSFVREIEAEDSLLGEIKRRFGGVVIANELMSKEDGERFIDTGVADALPLAETISPHLILPSLSSGGCL